MINALQVPSAKNWLNELDRVRVGSVKLIGVDSVHERQAKKDLEMKLEEAMVKRDAAAQKLSELQEAGADR